MQDIGPQGPGFDTSAVVVPEGRISRMTVSPSKVLPTTIVFRHCMRFLHTRQPHVISKAKLLMGILVRLIGYRRLLVCDTCLLVRSVTSAAHFFSSIISLHTSRPNMA